MREATLQRIKEILPIPNADNIELVKILGWECVVKKGEFQVGDLCVYFEIDSFLPIIEEFEFLNNNYRKMPDGTEGYWLRTVKLRKQLSQGLCMPLDILPNRCSVKLKKDPVGVRHDSVIINDIHTEIKEDLDVSDLLNVLHYEKPLPNDAGETKGHFPNFLSKTDETRIQSAPKLLNELKEKPYYITTKLDGTSGTFYKNEGEFGACSRNLEKKEYAGSMYWQIAEKYNLKEIPDNICIQGEIVGPGIQQNKLQLNEKDFFVFNIYEIEGHRKFSFYEMDEFCANNKLKIVPVIEVGEEFNYTQEELLEKAKGKYENSDKKKEGIVVRSCDMKISFKVLNNSYLLHEED